MPTLTLDPALRHARLTALATMVARMVGADQSYYMDSWYGSPQRDLKPDTTLGCGTICCVLGHWALTPQAQADGWDVLHEAPVLYPMPVYNTDSPYRRAAAYFGITLEESHSIFSPNNYPDDPDGSPIHASQILPRILALLEPQL